MRPKMERARCRAVGISMRSFGRIRTTSAASMATSVPELIGNAHVGRGKGRRVVDAIADHGDDRAALLELPDNLLFLVGRDTGEDVLGLMPTTAATASGRAALIASNDGGLDAHAVQYGDGSGRAFLDGVGRGRGGPRSLPSMAMKMLVVPAEDVEGGGLDRLRASAFALSCFRRFHGRLGHFDVVFTEEPDITDEDRCTESVAARRGGSTTALIPLPTAAEKVADAAVDRCARGPRPSSVLAAPRTALPIGCSLPISAKPDDGPPKTPAPLVVLPDRDKIHLRNAHLAVGDGARLVQHYLCNLGGRLRGQHRPSPGCPSQHQLRFRP